MLQAWLGSKSGIARDNGICSFVLGQHQSGRGGEGGTGEALLLEKLGSVASTQTQDCLKSHCGGWHQERRPSLLLGSLYELENVSLSPLFILLHFSYSISLKWNMIMLLAVASFQHSGIRPLHANCILSLKIKSGRQWCPSTEYYKDVQVLPPLRWLLRWMKECQSGAAALLSVPSHSGPFATLHWCCCGAISKAVTTIKASPLRGEGYAYIVRGVKKITDIWVISSHHTSKTNADTWACWQLNLAF